VVSFNISESFPLENDVEFPVVINRSGVQSEPVSVKLKVVPVRSEPGVDFVLPDPNPDVIEFAGSETIKELGVQLLDDEVPEPSEGVRLQLSDPGGGAVLGARPKLRLFFQDDDPDLIAPVTTIKRPKHGETYPDLNSVYGDVVDQGHGSAEIAAAIRRKMTDGSCRWLKANGSFVTGACSKIKFFDDFAGTNYLYAPLPGNLPSSVGTGTKNYTAFARSIDPDGNTESTFELGRNKNTFEIK
jgi:hypothetical protein